MIGSLDEVQFTANNATFGDAWVGTQKSFTVVYGYGLDPAVYTVVKMENESVSIPCATAVAIHNQRETEREVIAQRAQIKRERYHHSQATDTQRRLAEFRERQRDAAIEHLSNFQIDDLTNLDQLDSERFDRILELCRQCLPLRLPGVNIGLLGNTSVGKSSIINASVGREICETGMGQVTMEPRPYNMPNSELVFWDLPGKNDDISYLRAPYISCMKSMAFIGVVITATVSEVSSLIKMLQTLGIPYHIIVNKIDQARNAEQLARFRAQVDREVAGLGNCFRGVFYVSAEDVRLGDWTRLMDRITECEQRRQR